MRRVAALVRLADAVVENYLPSQFASLGIDRLRAMNPECVWVSVTPATLGGPVADQPSFDLLAQARSGIMGVTGEPDGPPMKVGAPVADVVTGLYGAIGLLAGLFARLADRPGRHFEAPMLESTMSALVNQAQGYLATGENPTRLGNDHPSITPYGPVSTPTASYCSPSAPTRSTRDWSRCWRTPRLAGHASWRDNAARVRDRDELRTELDRVFASRSTEQWLEILARSGVPHAPILDVAGAFAQTQIRDGDFVGVMDTPGGRSDGHAYAAGHRRNASDDSSRSASTGRRLRRDLRRLIVRRERCAVKGVGGRELLDGPSLQFRRPGSRDDRGPRSDATI